MDTHTAYVLKCQRCKTPLTKDEGWWCNVCCVKAQEAYDAAVREMDKRIAQHNGAKGWGR